MPERSTARHKVSSKFNMEGAFLCRLKTAVSRARKFMKKSLIFILGMILGAVLTVVTLTAYLIITPAPYTPVCPSAVLNMEASR